MNVLCCFCEEGSILLGIPSIAEWSIRATPRENGSVLTLQLNGDKDILLFSGNPVNLSGHTIEIKNFSTACTDVSESALNVNITYPHDGIRYYEAVTLPGDEAETKTVSGDRQTPYTDRTAHYKWSQILKYLEERLGTVTVESWFEDAMVTEFTEDTLRIEVGSDFRHEIIQRRCMDHIRNALTELFESNAAVEVYTPQAESQVR